MPSDPIILAFDTSAAHCAAALLCGDILLAERVEEMAKGQGERLLPLLEELLAETNNTWANLDAIGVGTGPGNFTGIRLSVAAARGLALSLNIPAIGVTSLEAAAYGVPRPLVAMIAAPRDRIYMQQFDNDTASAPELSSMDALQSIGTKAGMTWAGAHANEASDIYGGNASESAYSLAVAIARIARDRMSTETSRPTPMYVRAADAAPARDLPPTLLP